MSRRAAIYGELARLFAELAALEGGAPAAPAPPSSAPRRRARLARVPSVPMVPPVLSELDAQAAKIVTTKLRLAR